MPGVIRNTVDRLDKPSAYYQAKVIIISSHGSCTIAKLIKTFVTLE